MNPDRPGTIVLLHGFARSPRDLDDLAERFGRSGALVQVPHLSAWWWPNSTNNTRHLDRCADEIAKSAPAGPIVIVGHSAGAAAGAWIAGRLVEGVTEVAGQVTGLVLVDGVESPIGAIRRSWRLLDSVPITAVVGRPSRCNRHGALGRWLEAQSADGAANLQIVRMPDLGHGDIEGAGRSIYVRLCGDDPSAPARAWLLRVLDDAVARALDAGAN